MVTRLIALGPELDSKRSCGVSVASDNTRVARSSGTMRRMQGIVSSA